MASAFKLPFQIIVPGPIIMIFAWSCPRGVAGDTEAHARACSQSHDLGAALPRHANMSQTMAWSALPLWQELKSLNQAEERTEKREA
jgi:hypothetical protein